MLDFLFPLRTFVSEDAAVSDSEDRRARRSLPSQAVPLDEAGNMVAAAAEAEATG